MASRYDQFVRNVRGYKSLPRKETLADRVALSIRRLQALKAAKRNPYKRSFYRFLTECVVSVDEARGGQVRPWPTGVGEDGKSWDAIWLEEEDALLRQPRLMFEKSRRVLASWTVCAFDIWLAAGGQDPRWVNDQGQEVLMLSDRNRKIFLQARKAEGPAGAEWFISERIVKILEHFETYGGREKWPEFPDWKASCGLVQFPRSGGRIEGVPQGPDQVRGAGITLQHCEEVAFWERAKPTIGSAIPTLAGGGHLVLVTTPQVGSYARDIRDGKISRR